MERKITKDFYWGGSSFIHSETEGHRNEGGKVYVFMM